MAFVSGTRLGHYEIVCLRGKGPDYVGAMIRDHGGLTDDIDGRERLEIRCFQ